MPQQPANKLVPSKGEGVAQESGNYVNLKKSKNGHPSPGWPFNPLTLLSKKLAGYRLWRCGDQRELKRRRSRSHRSFAPFFNLMLTPSPAMSEFPLLRWKPAESGDAGAPRMILLPL